MVYDITFIYQHTPWLFTADFVVCSRSKQQSEVLMATSRMYLFEDKIEQSLLEELIASDQSSFSDESDLGGIDNLTVGEVIVVECSDNEKVTMYNLLQHPVRLVLRVLYLHGST
jgi:hypothetical protein